MPRMPPRPRIPQKWCQEVRLGPPHSTRAGGQDDGSLNKLPQISIILMRLYSHLAISYVAAQRHNPDELIELMTQARLQNIHTHTHTSTAKPCRCTHCVPSSPSIHTNSTPRQNWKSSLSSEGSPEWVAGAAAELQYIRLRWRAKSTLVCPLLPPVRCTCARQGGTKPKISLTKALCLTKPSTPPSPSSAMLMRHSCSSAPRAISRVSSLRSNPPTLHSRVSGV